jgi:MoxR-like ATPase
MSQTHARLERGLGQWTAEDAGSKNGTLLNGEPLQRGRLDDGDLLTFGYTIFLFRGALPVCREELALDATQLTPVAPGMMTLVPELERDLARLAQVAASGVTVMIRGETGTGKEVLARAVHTLSRRSGDFVAINCGALTDTLVESELFGHRKGAFSGAVEDYVGLVRSAHGGTLLLDEIGDLPPASQAAFLRVLQEREVMPVGATRAVPVDLRIISATHRDLEELVAQGKFRADLLARVSGFRLDLPPLRDRREDVGLLVAQLVRRLAGAAAGDVVFTESAARAPALRLAAQRARAREGAGRGAGPGRRPSDRPLAPRRLAARAAADRRRRRGRRGAPRAAARAPHRARRQHQRGRARHGQGADADSPLDAPVRQRALRVPSLTAAPV